MTITIRHGDCREVLRTLPDESVHCCVTSPPYFGLRDYGVVGQIGLEPTPEAFVEEMVSVFREVRRVLRADGTLWLNLGDSYAGYHGNKNATVPTSATNGWTNGTNENARTSTANRNGLKSKDLIGIPWQVALALRADGWYLRQDIIWSKPNPMPESITDRCTKAHEYVFLLSKSVRYAYDADAIKEPVSEVSIARVMQNDGKPVWNGDRARSSTQNPQTLDITKMVPADGMRNKRSVWTVPTQSFPDAHFATFPPDLIEPCIKAGCQKGGTVLDPFGGAGTTGLVADRLGRDAILIELNPEYAAIAERRLRGDAGMFADVYALPPADHQPTEKTEASQS
jgi:DNA modification methylase